MKKSIVLIAFVSFIVLFSSCSGLYSYKISQSASLTPDEVRLNLSMDDMNLLGETTISAKTSTYFGIFKSIDYINDEVYDFRKVTKVRLNGEKNINIPTDLDKAAYKVIDEYPTADYFVPVYYNEEVNRMFLGNTKTKTMVIKAYKLK